MVATRGGLGGSGAAAGQSKTDIFAERTDAHDHFSETITAPEPEPINHISVSSVVLDKNNRPLTKLTDEELLSGEISKNSKLFELKEKYLQGLKGLAANIARKGVEQPIKVYRHGNVYRAVYGERRVNASKIAREETIPAIILEKRPKDLRQRQAAENLQREGVLAFERMLAIEDVIDEYKKETGIKITKAEQLMPLLDKSRTQCQRYFELINLPDDVKVAAESGILLTIKQTIEVSKLEPGIRKELIDDSETNKELSERLKLLIVKKPEPEPAKKKTNTKKKKKGRQKSKVILGSHAETDRVKKIMETMSPDRAAKIDDWNDMEVVQTEWDLFWKEDILD